MKNLVFTITALISILLFSTVSYAQEIVVEGNGQGSQNQVNLSSSSTTTVDQQNNANIDNNTQVAAQTGDNQASGNTSEQTTITTGDAEVSSSIENSANTSVVQTDCCPQTQNITISGNGADSQNTVNTSITNTTNVTITQIAYINNTVHGNANTGRNSANDNLGNVSITTGDIKAEDNIKNGGVNLAFVEVGTSIGGNINISILDNGSNSQNSIYLSLSGGTTVKTDYSAYIDNYSIWDLNTGENSANGNIGNVDINTGDILFNSTIENGPINNGFVGITCCPKGVPPPIGNGPQPPPPPPPPPPPLPPPSNGPKDGRGDKNDDPGKGGDVLAAAIGNILPATGSPWMLLMSFASILMFLMGWYLRLRSGNAPPKAYAV